MKIKVRVGDVFLIPLDEQSWALAQLVSAWNDELYVAVFDQETKDRSVDPATVLKLQPALLALTLDAKLFHGHWPIIGNIQVNLGVFPQPSFKVGQSGTMHVESRGRSVRRPATPSETLALRYRRTSYPAVLEDATKAIFGKGVWNTHYDHFLPEYAIMSEQLLPTKKVLN